MDLVVRFSDSAVVAVLLADVAELDQPPERHELADLSAFDGIRRGEKCVRIGTGQRFDQFPMRQRTWRSGRFVQ